jgi:predicted esterase YcpF (UPF0227 family)
MNKHALFVAVLFAACSGLGSQELLAGGHAHRHRSGGFRNECFTDCDTSARPKIFVVFVEKPDGTSSYDSTSDDLHGAAQRIIAIRKANPALDPFFMRFNR